MAAIAEGYLDISDETIKNKKYENRDDAEAFNREILKYWNNKNCTDDQIYVSETTHGGIQFSTILSQEISAMKRRK